VKSRGKRKFGRPWRKWENNIKIYLRIMGYKDETWTDMIQNTV